MAAPIPDERCLVLTDTVYFVLWKNNAGYHPGTVQPSTTDGAPLQQLVERKKQQYLHIEQKEQQLSLSSRDLKRDEEKRTKNAVLLKIIISDKLEDWRRCCCCCCCCCCSQSNDCWSGPAGNENDATNHLFVWRPLANFLLLYGAFGGKDGFKDRAIDSFAS